MRVEGLDAHAARLAVWRRNQGAWRFSVQPATETSIALAGSDVLGVSAVNRAGVESARTLFVSVVP